MDLVRADGGESRFAAYVEGLARVIGHKDRIGPLRDYCTGLMLPCERKSMEPMAAVTAPARTAAQHQSLLHFVGEGGWSDERVLAKVREMGIAGDRAARADRGLDHRRYRLSQAGTALGRGDASVLWPAWQAGQLPGGGVALAGQSPCQPAGGLAALSAARVGGRPRAAAQGGVPEHIAFATKPESPRHAVHRGLRLPDLRAGDDSPLWTSCHQALPGGCLIRGLSTPRLRRCGPNVTSQTRSQPCAAA